MAKLDLSYFNSLKIYKISKAELREFPEKLRNGENVLSRNLFDETDKVFFYLYTLSYKHGTPHLLEQKMPKHLKNMTPDDFAQCSLQLAEGFKEAAGIPPVSRKRKPKRKLFERAKQLNK